MPIIIILYGNGRLVGNPKEAVGAEGKVHRKWYSCAQFFVHYDGTRFKTFQFVQGQRRRHFLCA
ncbi:hypothetical protein C6A37_04480 [Desulfobacteraceae bacterium SEEP-SAG9]|nr:hypothetical protein C6A37_04480 [Desulfobacteraceae bacterium SEEP-SAG9]